MKITHSETRRPIKNIGEVPPKTLYEAEAVTRGKLDTDQYRLLLRRYRDFVAEIIIHNPQRESSIRQAAESLGIDVDHGNPWPPRGKRSYKEYKEVSEKYKTLIKNIGEVPPKVSGESIIFNGEKYLSEYQFKYGLPQYIDFVAKIILYHPSRGPKIRQAAESLGIPWTDISNRVHYLTNAL